MSCTARGVGGAGCDVSVDAAVGYGVVEGVGDGVALAVGVDVGEGGAVGVGEAITARVGSGPSLGTAAPQAASYSDAAS